MGALRWGRWRIRSIELEGEEMAGEVVVGGDEGHEGERWGESMTEQ